ncbi:MaoC family dehydratase [uncultured Bradyrhizobium sp.]|uniref:MaoC family dehydratase n=1 Tax=uncultured Bradyrhizobium sp. TaxID=199684 RepID=UPI002613050B|nr:MaoC family dehydratase [uncultured Bradyrhizobium sp.]
MSEFNLAELKSASRIVDRAAIRLYAEITDDFNPIHLDPEFAAATPMRGIIAHGMLSLNLIWQSLRASYGAGAAQGARLEVRFVRPVRENDVVTASGRLKDAGAGVYDVVVASQNGEPVISGTLSLRK